MAGERRPRGLAGVWRPWAGIAGGPLIAPALFGHVRAGTAHLRALAGAEVARGELMPWMAVAFGAGIALYFSADREPVLAAPLALAGTLAGAAFLCRVHARAFAALLLATALVVGFAAATLKRAVIEHPVLARAAWNVEVSGFVEAREERARSDRIVVRVHSFAAPRVSEALERVRVSARKGTAPPVGSFVTFKARLSPPLQPLRPGGYDYARDMYFHGIGASGFVLGRLQRTEAPYPPGLWLRAAAAIGHLRDAIDARIRAVLPGDRGAIASALITGKRDAISTPVNDAMYVSSLAHVLSISGYHMALIAGVVFFAIRAGFALIPAAAERHPIKKWSAAAALVAAAFYLLLSGAEVATQRSFIMVAIVLIGVMADRPALTLRTLTLAVFAVLLLAPESLAHPSFQMSFAATLVLVAAYRGGMAWANAAPDTALGARLALWGVREVAMLILASLLAGAATAPYAAYHFHRLAPYGVIANLLAMPVVSLWVMPAGLLGIVALPFGLDSWCWRAMGEGIEWMIAVAQGVASLPGAVGRVHGFGIGALALGTLGLVMVCLMRTPLRFAGLALVAVGILLAARERQPDVLISADGVALAVRQSDGRLALTRSGGDTFAFRDWLSADADARAPTDRTLGQGFACDVVGCVARLPDGRKVSHARDAEAVAEDCGLAAIVVASRRVSASCAALLIDAQRLTQTGAVALHRAGERFTVTPARPPGHDRPWVRAPAPVETQMRASPGPTGDATPRTEDIEPGD